MQFSIKLVFHIAVFPIAHDVINQLICSLLYPIVFENRLYTFVVRRTHHEIYKRQTLVLLKLIRHCVGRIHIVFYERPLRPIFSLKFEMIVQPQFHNHSSESDIPNLTNKGGTLGGFVGPLEKSLVEVCCLVRIRRMSEQSSEQRTTTMPTGIWYSEFPKVQKVKEECISHEYKFTKYIWYWYWVSCMRDVGEKFWHYWYSLGRTTIWKVGQILYKQKLCTILNKVWKHDE